MAMKIMEIFAKKSVGKPHQVYTEQYAAGFDVIRLVEKQLLTKNVKVPTLKTSINFAKGRINVNK